ncbi:MAG TPA: hypothetical protein VN716_18880 [Vicinamibacterales bacterium]|nr:hypothetical protein [Vicinamibacterales bacterium]
MGRTTHTPVQKLGPYPRPLALAAASQKVAVAADATNREQVKLTGKETVHIYNSGATPRAIVFTSVADAQGRTGDLTDTIAAGATGVYGTFPVAGFQQADGNLYFECAHAECLIIVTRDP